MQMTDLPEWLEFLEHRKEMRRPVTKVGAKRLLAKLERFAADGQDVAAILVRSIENGWVGVFAIPPQTFTPQEMKNRGVQAWTEVRAAIQRGVCREIWTDSLTQAAIKACGGWMYFADMRSDAAPFFEKRFVQEFCTINRSKVA